MAFEQHRQHDDWRAHLEQRRANRHGIGRQFGDRQAALVAAHWPIKPFADADPVRMTVAPSSA
jgi:hypothetical protein